MVVTAGLGVIVMLFLTGALGIIHPSDIAASLAVAALLGHLFINTAITLCFSGRVGRVGLARSSATRPANGH